ncbi:2-succinyl-5-enolpyruvyl-6-hydroxy-3-cyclohexene-1-carboxylic-acid synthase [Gracilibacillus sp. YIM 98692]|uniref:2-succinyl-5-enolpyruvyl-6-hydroxy-3- cyclohexene-1-carboxylic-acid synthase n=1 Tax=Gracilibacillus sp. YIM 98692 TaxID=2663532 RepID=UPI0013D24540|nr:2-succinyl-5-enolpyruvyl-6-hydroxy-3-cyclohexene-1-carboxylic-acid synthase [Gracilibacillus sp. YIM 98692]
MNYKESLTRYVAQFVAQLYSSGVKHVVISPGSRSTPLALTFAEFGSSKVWVDIDERSAGYFALGLAKQTKEAVALLCTSGTAAANYYPAVIEGYYSRVPLIVLTADRPHELREVGAPQAIDQIKMYGDYVKWFHEMALPDSDSKVLQYVRNQANRAVTTAMHPNRGPVHLNFPFREPLIPDFAIDDIWQEEKRLGFLQTNSSSYLAEQDLNGIADKLKNKRKGIIVCGPADNEGLAQAMAALAQSWNIPILADPLSPLRNGKHDKDYVIECYDAILKSEEVRREIDIDFVIRFGAMPVSKPYLQWIQSKTGVEHFIVEEVEGDRDPTGIGAHYVYGKPDHIARSLASRKDIVMPSEWLQSWQDWNAKAKVILQKVNEEELLTEGDAVLGIQETIPADSVLYVGNSMPIRDVDTFWHTSDRSHQVLANRGTNGIDGVISSALGAAVSGRRVTLLIGDISFLHSMNGLLLANQYRFDLTIVLINNAGGGIFSFLPQAKQESDHYEHLFGTPQQIDMKKVSEIYHMNYNQPTKWKDFLAALNKSYQYHGVSMIEIRTDRKQNVEWHREKWGKVKDAILDSFEDENHVL